MSTKKDSKERIEEIFMADNDLETLRLTLKYLKKKNAGRYEEEFVNSICQYGHYSGSFDLYDAYHLMIIEEHIMAGKLYYKKINVGYSPSSDYQIEENNQKLLNLPKPFKAEFIPSKGRGAEDDGFFRSESEKTGLLRRHDGVELEEEVSMRQVRLEVGSTESHTTFKHIFNDGGVARWPYYSNHIYLFYNPTPASLLISRKGQWEIDDTNPDIEDELTELLNLQLHYTGPTDDRSLIDILQRVNESVEKCAIPTNLYTYTLSQLDICILDFYRFDVNEFSSRDKLCIIGVRDKYDRKTNHMIVRPNSTIFITIEKDRTEGAGRNYPYLAVRFRVHPM